MDLGVWGVLSGSMTLYVGCVEELSRAVFR